MGESGDATFAGLVLKLLIFVSILIGASRSKRIRAIVRRRMERRVRHASPDPRFAMDMKTAIVVHERRTTSGAGQRAYDVFHRILRNPSGQYFLHIYSPDEDASHIEWLPRERAMNALRDDPEVFRREFGEQDAPPAGGWGSLWPFWRCPHPGPRSSQWSVEARVAAEADENGYAVRATLMANVACAGTGRFAARTCTPPTCLAGAP